MRKHNVNATMAALLRFFKTSVKWVWRNQELCFWVAALILLYYLPVNDHHYSLCVPSMLGFEKCLGCGIGHSIHHYLHLEITEGWEHHYLGAFAVGVIFFRIINLIRLTFKYNYINYAKQNL